MKSSISAPISKKRKLRQRGSEIVEFGLTCLPLFGFLFLTLDIAWMLFAQLTLQSAVRNGVRYAITGQTQAGLGQDASIKAVVQSYAIGFLPGTAGSNMISINYYQPLTLASTTSNAAGNLVEISITGFSITPIGPIYRSNSAVSIFARASDIVEPSPGGVAPAR